MMEKMYFLQSFTMEYCKIYYKSYNFIYDGKNIYFFTCIDDTFMDP